MIQFTLYSRSYCHLCQDMRDQLQAALGDSSHAIDVIDIDVEGNEALLEQYDELVPVLTASRNGEETQQLCHYFMDLVALSSYVGQSTQSTESMESKGTHHHDAQ